MWVHVIYGGAMTCISPKKRTNRNMLQQNIILNDQFLKISFMFNGSVKLIFDGCACNKIVDKD
jgi:hypothetical protein